MEAFKLGPWWSWFTGWSPCKASVAGAVTTARLHIEQSIFGLCEMVSCWKWDFKTHSTSAFLRDLFWLGLSQSLINLGNRKRSCCLSEIHAFTRFVPMWQFRNGSNCFLFYFQDFEFYNRDAVWFCQRLKNCVDSYCQLPLTGMCQLPAKGLWWENNLKRMLLCIHFLPIFAWSKLVTEGSISIKSGKGCLWSCVISRHIFDIFNRMQLVEIQTRNRVFSGSEVRTYSLFKLMQLKSCLHMVAFLIKPIDRFSWASCYSRIATVL